MRHGHIREIYKGQIIIIERMNRTQQAAVNMVTNATGLVVPLFINFITTPILLRLLGQEGYGLQSLALVISGYLAIMDLGMDIPITKLLAGDHALGDRRLANQLLNTTLLLYVIIGLGGFFIIFACRSFLVYKVFDIPAGQINNAMIVFQLAGAGFALNLLCAWGRACSYGIQRYDIPNAIRISTLAISSIVGVIVVYIGYGLVGFILTRVTAYGVSAIAYFYTASRLIPYFRFKPQIDVETLRRIRGYVGMGLLFRVTDFFAKALDRTLIGMWLGVSAVAVYAIQWSILSASSGLLNSLFAFFFPMTSELHSTDKLEELKDIFKKTTRFSVAVTLLIFPMLLLYGDVFLKLWVGEAIGEQAKYILPLLVTSCMISQLAVGVINFLSIGMGKLRAFSIYSVVRGMILAVGLLIFIRLFGFVGTGLAFLLANLADISFFMFVLRNYLKISFYQLFQYSYMYPFIIAVLMYTTGLLIKPYVDSWLSLMAAVGFLSIAYIWGGFIARVFGKTEKKLVLDFGNILLRPLKR